MMISFVWCRLRKYFNYGIWRLVSKNFEVCNFSWSDCKTTLNLFNEEQHVVMLKRLINKTITKVIFIV